MATSLFLRRLISRKKGFNRNFNYMNSYIYKNNISCTKKIDKEVVDLNLRVFNEEVEEKENIDPIVIIHGLFGSGQNWRTFVNKHLLPKKDKVNKVYLVDLRNHGDSGHHESMKIEEMMEDVIETINSKILTRKNQKVNLIGHSLGGKVSMHVAVNAPDLVNNLVIVDVLPVKYGNSTQIFGKYIDAMLNLPLNELKKRSDASELLKPDIPNDLIRGFLLTNLTSKESKNGTLLDWRINLKAIQNNLRNINYSPLPQSKEFKGNSVFVGGKNSDYLPSDPLETKKIINPNFPNNKVYMLDNAGHWVHFEQPVALSNIIIDSI
eukprot:TRINITY_DN11118_c0_g1_i1.p1 TRINITY_DN11118_c0_g1~~TRINITY_DN11118_c0_g1_i1.p1  ORF type:complete len:322 (-),score=65.75 TRINITY_DN11118_c0_g1_i1:56-1021(-)